MNNANKTTKVNKNKIGESRRGCHDTSYLMYHLTMTIERMEQDMEVVKQAENKKMYLHADKFTDCVERCLITCLIILNGRKPDAEFPPEVEKSIRKALEFLEIRRGSYL